MQTKMREEFAKIFGEGREPEFYFAPGRVNLRQDAFLLPELYQIWNAGSRGTGKRVYKCSGR